MTIPEIYNDNLIQIFILFIVPLLTIYAFNILISFIKKAH